MNLFTSLGNEPMKTKRGKARSVALAVAALAAAATFTVIGAGTSFAGGGLPEGSKVTGHGTGKTAEAAESAAYLDAARQCASGAISGSEEGGNGTSTKNSDGTWSGTYTDICVSPSADG